MTPMRNHRNITAKAQEFMTAFGGPYDLDLWYELIMEEAEEVCEAIETHDTVLHHSVLKELCDLDYVTGGMFITYRKVRVEDKDKALAFSRRHFHNTHIILSSMLPFYQVFPDDIYWEAFLRVHNSNMSKLGEDGKPIKREDGKVLKGPNYKEPDLRSLITSTYGYYYGYYNMTQTVN